MNNVYLCVYLNSPGFASAMASSPFEQRTDHLRFPEWEREREQEARERVQASLPNSPLTSSSEEALYIRQSPPELPTTTPEPPEIPSGSTSEVQSADLSAIVYQMGGHFQRLLAASNGSTALHQGVQDAINKFNTTIAALIKAEGNDAGASNAAVARTADRNEAVLPDVSNGSRAGSDTLPDISNGTEAWGQNIQNRSHDVLSGTSNVPSQKSSDTGRGGAGHQSLRQKSIRRYKSISQRVGGKVSKTYSGLLGREEEREVIVGRQQEPITRTTPADPGNLLSDPSTQSAPT